MSSSEHSLAGGDKHKNCTADPADCVPLVLDALWATSNTDGTVTVGWRTALEIDMLGFGVLRGLMRRSSIIENNINQTIASAVNGASAGMMFSIPALFILATPERDPEGRFALLTQFNIGLMVLACITGGILGLSFIIPLRKQMIDFDRLAYPGGIAVAAIDHRMSNALWMRPDLDTGIDILFGVFGYRLEQCFHFFVLGVHVTHIDQFAVNIERQAVVIPPRAFAQ